MKFASIAFIATTSAITLRGPTEDWSSAAGGAKLCPNGDVARVKRVGGTDVARQDGAGGSCTNNIGDSNLISIREGPTESEGWKKAAAAVNCENGDSKRVPKIGGTDIARPPFTGETCTNNIGDSTLISIRGVDSDNWKAAAAS